MSAQPSPLPGASEVVLGVLNVAGQTVTVVDFARRIGCRPTVIEPSHYFVIVELDGFPCALVVDHIAGIRRHVAGQPPWHGDSEGDALVAGAVQLDDGLCLVLDPGRFLFEQDKKQLASALAEAGHD
jgi:purine-binding chemotaxis protein CheW